MEEVFLGIYREPDLDDRTDWGRLIASALFSQDAGPPARGAGRHPCRIRTGLDLCRLAHCLEDWNYPSG